MKTATKIENLPVISTEVKKKAKIYYTSYFPPYFKKFKSGEPNKTIIETPTIPSINKKETGVYIIKEKGKDGKVKYVGYSSRNVYKTSYRHFQSWEDRQIRITFPKFGYVIRYILVSKEIAKYIKAIEEANIAKYYNTILNPRKELALFHSNNPKLKALYDVITNKNMKEEITQEELNNSFTTNAPTFSNHTAEEYNDYYDEIYREIEKGSKHVPKQDLDDDEVPF